MSDAARRLAALAVEAGARGLVCSPQEVAAVRAEVGDDILLITPGVRPGRSRRDDQARVATPEEALRSGADLLVIGRPITGAADPGAAAAAIAASLRRADAVRALGPARQRGRLTEHYGRYAALMHRRAVGRRHVRPRCSGRGHAFGAAVAGRAPCRLAGPGRCAEVTTTAADRARYTADGRR